MLITAVIINPSYRNRAFWAAVWACKWPQLCENEEESKELKFHSDQKHAAISSLVPEQVVTVTMLLFLFFFFFSSWFERIKIPPHFSSHFFVLQFLHTPPPPPTPARLHAPLATFSYAVSLRTPPVWLLWGEAVRQRATGPGVDMTGADRRKGLLSCCITGRTTHHVPLEPVTCGTADVAFIDQAPAWSWAAACSSDWQPLVRSSFMHRLLLFMVVIPTECISLLPILLWSYLIMPSKCWSYSIRIVSFVLYFNPTLAFLTSFAHIVRRFNFSDETASYSWIPSRIPSGFHQATSQKKLENPNAVLSLGDSKITMQKQKLWGDFTLGFVAISFGALLPQETALIATKGHNYHLSHSMSFTVVCGLNPGTKGARLYICLSVY